MVPERAVMDCGPSAAGPKKACKNCSCGYVECLHSCCTSRCLCFGHIEKCTMFVVTSTCARRTGAVVRVERRRRERRAVRGRRARWSDTRSASQTFEHMHNTPSHRVKSYAPGGTLPECSFICALRDRLPSRLSHDRSLPMRSQTC